MKKPKAPKEDPSTILMRERQVADLSRLDEEENRRVKQLLVSQRGGRFFRGSPMLRARPSDSAAPAAGAVGGAGAAPRSMVTAVRQGLFGASSRGARNLL